MAEVHLPDNLSPSELFPSFVISHLFRNCFLSFVYLSTLSLPSYLFMFAPNILSFTCRRWWNFVQHPTQLYKKFPSTLYCHPHPLPLSASFLSSPGTCNARGMGQRWSLSMIHMYRNGPPPPNVFFFFF